MINIDKIQELPLHDLLVYREALLTLIDKYEKMIDPRFSRLDGFANEVTSKEIENRGKLTKFQGYLQTLMLIIENKTISELENGPQKTNTTPKAKTNKAEKKKQC